MEGPHFGYINYTKIFQLLKNTVELKSALAAKVAKRHIVGAMQRSFWQPIFRYVDFIMSGSEGGHML